MFTIKSSLEKKVLTYFFLNTDAKLYLREMARKLQLNPANLDKKMKQLEAIGLFVSEFQGKQKYYSLNKKFPLFKEYKAIIKKTFGVAPQLIDILKNIKKINKAYLFGSYAQDNFDTFSDIDVLIIGNFDHIALSKALHVLERNLDREINTITMSTKEFQKKIKNKNEFLLHIFNNKYIQIL